MKNILIVISVLYLFSSCSSEKIAMTGNGRNNDLGKLMEQGGRKEVRTNSSINSKIASDNIISSLTASSQSDMVVLPTEILSNLNAPLVSYSNSIFSKSEKLKLEVIASQKTIKVENVLALKLNNIFKNLLKNNNSTNTAHPAPAGDRSWLVALLVCFFLGGLGIHRFYLGYTTIGIIQLLTGGGCGIWAFIDLIRIIIGDLKPNGGGYSDKP